MLGKEEASPRLAAINSELTPQLVLLDMDSTEIPVYGQDNGASIGYFARGVMAKVEFHFGELLPRMGYIMAALETDSLAAVRFYYNKRGTADQSIKEGRR